MVRGVKSEYLCVFITSSMLPFPLDDWGKETVRMVKSRKLSFLKKARLHLTVGISGVSILGDMTSTVNDPKTGSIGDNTAF